MSINLRQLVSTSKTFSAVKSCCNNYIWAEQWLTDTWYDSNTFKLASSYWGKLSIYLKFSFLGRITEPDRMTPAVLENSQAVQHIITLVNSGRSRIVKLFEGSLSGVFIKITRQQLKFFPMRLASISLIIAIDLNVVLSYFLHRQITLYGWSVRGAFFLAAILVLLSQADQPAYKQTSVFLKKIGLN